MNHIRLKILLFCLIGLSGNALADTIDNYQIHLRDKIVVRETGDKLLRLDESNKDDKLQINYNHCSPYHGDRRLFVKDAEGNVIWRQLYMENDTTYQMEVEVADWLSCGSERARPARLLYVEEGNKDSILLANLDVAYVKKAVVDMSVFEYEFSTPTKILISLCLASFAIVIVVMRVKAFRNRNKKTW